MFNALANKLLYLIVSLSCWQLDLDEVTNPPQDIRWVFPTTPDSGYAVTLMRVSILAVNRQPKPHGTGAIQQTSFSLSNIYQGFHWSTQNGTNRTADGEAISLTHLASDPWTALLTLWLHMCSSFTRLEFLSGYEGSWPTWVLPYTAFLGSTVLALVKSFLVLLMRHSPVRWRSTWLFPVALSVTTTTTTRKTGRSSFTIVSTLFRSWCSWKKDGHQFFIGLFFPFH